MKTLTADQITALYTFTRQHFVEHYDLQTELVDHLANAIEQRWATDPAVSFDDALKAEFKKFGVFGFSDVVEQKGKALGRRYLKLKWGYFREFFTLPKVLLTLALVLAMGMLLRFNVWVALSIYILLQLASFIKLFANVKAFNKKAKETGRKWMLEEMIFRGVTFTALAGFWFQFGQMMYYTHNVYAQWVLATVCVLLLLHNYIVLYVIPSKAEQYLKETYPEYAIA
nr:hypothetical protein [uncultured Flavobacterium sp.]